MNFFNEFLNERKLKKTIIISFHSSTIQQNIKTKQKKKNVPLINNNSCVQEENLISLIEKGAKSKIVI